MSKNKFVLNRSGVQALLKSEEMKKILEEHASSTLGSLGEGYDSDSYVGKNRVNVSVFAKSWKAKKENLKNNSILKALK